MLVYLKDAQVLRVFDQELYLLSWEEVWRHGCQCSSQSVCIRKKQSLIDIVRAKNTNMKEAVHT